MTQPATDIQPDIIEDTDQIWLGSNTDQPFMAARTPDGIALFGGHPYNAYPEETVRRLTLWLAGQLGIPTEAPPF